jgi:L-rhamnose-H+ transport protein
MNLNLIHGFALAFVAGVIVGFNLWSIKWARVWKWENFWLVYSLVSLWIVPLGLGFWVVPRLGSVYASLSPESMIRPLLFGAFWGFAQLGAGVCVHRLGFAVTGAILNGIGVAVGTLVPLILQHREMLMQSSGLLVLAGTGVTVVGVTLCGWSGFQREQETRRQGRGAGFAPRETAMSQVESTRTGYMVMVAIAVMSGVLSSLLNIALAFGGDIMETARRQGAQPAWAPFAVWPIALLGGSIVNIGYSVYLLFRNKTWGNFRGGVRELFNPVLAACLWMGGIALYSSGTTFLGILGVSIGFALYTITMILCGQLAAVFTGEWYHMKAKIYAAFAGGLAFLLLAVVTIGAANYFAR